MSSLTARAYRPGDEADLVALWQRAYAGYAGHVRRTESYWRWAILDRPGVVPEDVVILEKLGKICAYGVLGPEGVVLELAVSPDELDSHREQLAIELLGAIEKRWFERGDYGLALTLPSDDECLRRALDVTGYQEEPHGSGLQVVPIDLVELVRELLTNRLARLRQLPVRTFRFVLAPGACRFLAYPGLSVVLDPLAVEPIDTSESAHDCTIEIELSALTDLIFRRSTYDELVARHEISIIPVSAERHASALLGAIVIENLWFTPSADER